MQPSTCVAASLLRRRRAAVTMRCGLVVAALLLLVNPVSAFAPRWASRTRAATLTLPFPPTTKYVTEQRRQNPFPRWREKQDDFSFAMTRCATSSSMPVDEAADADSRSVATATPADTRRGGRSRRVAILVCPAQFCVPDDYQVFFDNLSQWRNEQQQQLLRNDDEGVDNILAPEIGTCRVAPLPRTEWIKVAQHLPTRAFLEGRLPVASTLSWYFDAMDNALAEIFAAEHSHFVAQQRRGQDHADEPCSLCIIGHSIGGWVARAYLGGLSASATAVQRMAVQRCSSFITLGTPHVNGETALVDQTRGLLRAIADSPSCHPQALIEASATAASNQKNGMEITCVCSSGVDGSFFTTNVEQFVAASSYLPLLGRLNNDDDDNNSATAVRGDGIVPLDLAFLEAPARRVIVEQCARTTEPVRHSHVIPTPWNLINGYAPSIQLPPQEYPSYISQGVLSQWARYIQ